MYAYRYSGNRLTWLSGTGGFYRSRSEGLTGSLRIIRHRRIGNTYLPCFTIRAFVELNKPNFSRLFRKNSFGVTTPLCLVGLIFNIFSSVSVEKYIFGNLPAPDDCIIILEKSTFFWHMRPLVDFPLILPDSHGL